MKYYGTKNGSHFGFFSEEFEGAIQVSDKDWQFLQVEQSLGKKIVSDNISVFATNTPDKFYVNENGLWVERTEEEYLLFREENEKEKEIKSLKQKINELDKKRIRAVCEPSTKDETTGETWLDFYNSQIIELRNQITKLEGNNNENM